MVVLSNMSATNQNAATAATTSVDFVDLSKVQNVPSTSVHSGDLSKKVVKCTYQTTVSKWLGKKTLPGVKTISSKTIKDSIGNCSICQSFYDYDNVILPECSDTFCRSCLYNYLDKTALVKPYVEKQDFDYGSIRRAVNTDSLFTGVFDASLLDFNGCTIPTLMRETKPLTTKLLEDKQNPSARIRRIMRLTAKKQLYRLVKVEDFECPNCKKKYENVRRHKLPKNTLLSSVILELSFPS